MNKDYKATLKIQEFPVKRGWYIKGLDKKEFPVKFQKAVLKKHHKKMEQISKTEV